MAFNSTEEREKYWEDFKNKLADSDAAQAETDREKSDAARTLNQLIRDLRTATSNRQQAEEQHRQNEADIAQIERLMIDY